MVRVDRRRIVSRGRSWMYFVGEEEGIGVLDAFGKGGQGGG
jgi:hypothetical protein